ncbi:MAG TPA: FkbM family methyltransferase [Candidatus Dormibacteraeota bacterium]|nr:FkbM family methyltransferase [Candidatus Dormibacteraeota bacterium]
MIRSAVRKVRGYLQTARLRALGTEPGWAQVEGGFEMFIDPNDSLDQEFYLGTFEPAMRELIAQVVRAGDTCLDIGAQKGYVSLTMAQAVGDSGKVFSFEADARAAEKFLANVKRSKQSSIHLMQFALGEKEGTCTFVLSDVLGWSSRFPNELAKNAVHKVVEVPMHSLDAIIERKELDVNFEKLSFIKMDVEGSEPFVIKGMRKLLATARPIVFLEVNYDSLAAAGSSAEEVQELLQDLGYNLYHPSIDRYFRKVSLEPCNNLSGLRPTNSHFTNVVAVHRAVLGPTNKISRLITQRN